MLFIFQDAGATTANYIPLWVAIVGFLGALFGSGLITGVVLWYLNKSKFKTEVKGQDIKNIGEDLKNFDFQNDIFNKVKEEITRLRDENSTLSREKHELEKRLEMKGYELAEERGKRQQAIDDRDRVADRMEALENSIREANKKFEADLEFEHKNCQQQIINLGLKYEAWKRWATGRMEELSDILTAKGIEVPINEYNEAEALKGVLINE